MAQVIYTSKNVNKSTTTVPVYGKKAKAKIPLFRTLNYILMAIGIVVLAAGYIALTGGGSEDPSQFSPAIFDTRRLFVAPILMLLGLVIEVVAIMYHPRNKKVNPNIEENAKAE